MGDGIQPRTMLTHYPRGRAAVAHRDLEERRGEAAGRVELAAARV
jgi:hypothetical protein